MYTGISKVEYAERAFLNRKHWTQTDADRWVSEYFTFADGLPMVLALSKQERLKDVAQDIYGSYVSLHSIDDVEARSKLEQLLPDTQDYTRWAWQIEDRKIFVRFNVDSETALELSGYGDDEREAYHKWGVVSELCDMIATNDENTNTIFEQVGRFVWEMWSDEKIKSAKGWLYYSDVFKEQEMIELAESPAILLKIDLRQKVRQRTNLYRFFFLLELDSVFPDRHFLLERHLTDLTQKHVTEIKDLLKRIKSAEITVEDADKELTEILSDEQEEPERTFTVTIKGKDVYIDGELAIRFTASTDNPFVVKTQSRLILQKISPYVHIPTSAVMVSTDAGVEKIGEWLGGEDPEILAFLEKRGIGAFEL